ncbi:hypothetical protein V8G54_023970, partial [Vigna mungo]
MDLVKSHISYIRKRKDPLGSRFILDNELDWTNINPFFSMDPREKVQQSLSKNHGTIHMLLNRNEKCRSLIILSSSNCFQIRSFHDGKYSNGIKEEMNPIQRDPLIPIQNSLGIRSANPYLATPGTTVHGHYGEILSEGDILVTFIYQKSRSGDITQGLPKVEQVLEVRSIDSISINLEKRVDTWNGRITRILGIPWGFFISAELTIAQSRISLVNQIQKVYRSQGVHIHNRHIEIIVRQITSKVLVSEDGMSNVFLPGELIGLLRAERAGRSLEESICYRVLLLGITKTSLNTQSFISEASFQETARVLSKAALRGRIDWLKGLKENVVLGGMMPVASGGKQFLIVGTKKKAADSVARAAIRARCHYVNKKWLGGMLTNWYTTKTRLQKFRDLRMQQKTGRFQSFPKKDAALLKRQLAQLETYLGGIQYMKGLPDIVIIVDQQEEYTALRECITLEIPTICLIDTNSDPDLADISIPANDDAIASIRLILNKLVFAISILVIRNLQTIPTFGQNLFEYVLEFIRDVSKTQIGEEYGALLPWKIIQLPHGELAAPTNDINTTVALALLTSVAYFYAVPIPVMFLGLFTSGIQALIFATLAAAYI